MESDIDLDAILEGIREHLRAGRLDVASDECRVLSQQAPDEARVWILLGRIAAKQGRLADAEAAIRKVLELEPENAPVWNWLGRVARSRDHIVESEQYLRKAAGLQPETASFWLDLGTTLCDVGSWDEAVNALLKAHCL